MLAFYFNILTKIALCSHFLIASTSKCDLIELEPNQFMIALQPHARLIEMDSDNFEQLNEISFGLIQQAFNISYLKIESIISIVITDYIFYNSTSQKWICKLVKNSSYNIMCNHLKLYPTNNDESNMKIQLKVDILTEIQPNCDEFFYWQILNFLLFCSSQNVIKLYSVDISNTTLLITEMEISQNQFEFCKRGFIKQSESFFFVLHSCFQWAIYEFSGQSLELLIDQNIMLNQTNTSIPYVESIQICGYLNKDISIYYLITNDGYYQYTLSNNKTQFSWDHFQRFQNVKQLILTNWCQVKYLIIEQNQITTVRIDVLKKEYVNISSNVIQAHESSNLLFILNNKGLNVILNQKIRQHISIQVNCIFFLDNYNYFYFIDELHTQISFYSYNDLNSLLIPTSPYVFQILVNDHFEIRVLNCYQVRIKKNIDLQIVFNDIEIFNQCQQSSSIIFEKESIVEPQYYEFQVSIDSIEIILNITDIVDFQNNCDNRFIFKDSYLILLDDIHNIIKNNHYITILNCINNIYQKIPIYNHNVFQYEFNFLIVKKGEKRFTIIYYYFCQEFLNYQVSVQNEIEYFAQFENYVLILTQKAQNLMIIKIDSLGKENLQKSLFSKLKLIYIREQQNSNTIFFYSKQFKYIFIQFLSNLITYDLDTDQINDQPLTNIQIISLKHLIHNAYQIIAVHLIEDMIFQYIFINQQPLTVQYKYHIINAKFRRPLKFHFENHKMKNNKQGVLIILVLKEQQNQIYIFRVSQSFPVKLIKIINVSIPEFFIIKSQLYYYDENFQIKVIEIFLFHIQLQNLVINYRNVTQSTNLTFYIVSKNTTENIIKCIFRLYQYNLCQQIFKINNLTEIIYNNQQKQQIAIKDFFVGPINSLYISNNQMIKLHGFYLQQTPIQYCQQLNESNCIITINISDELLPDLKEKFIAQIFKYKQQNILLSFRNELKVQQDALSLFISVFLINDWQLGIITSLKNQITLIICDIDMDTFELRNEQRFYLFTNYNLHNYQIHFTGTIIKVQTNDEEILFFTRSLLMKSQQLENFTQNLLFVEDSIQLYVELQSQNQNLIIKILELDNNDSNLELFHFMELNFTTIKSLFLNRFNNLFGHLQKHISNHLLRSIQIRNEIQLVVLQEYSIFSLILNISVEMSKFQAQFEIQQILRNPSSSTFKYIFYYQNILILTTDKEERYLYYLDQEKQFHDYFYKENSASKLISYINSTHFIFLNSNGNYSIGQLNYEIELLQGHLNQELCTLVAENSISKIDIKLIIATQSKGQIWIICILIISIIVILSFIIYKSLIKIKSWRQNTRHTQIELQNSNLQSINQ